LQASPTHTITGLSSTPISDPINNYFKFSQTSSFNGLTGTGTTPPNRFEFDLLTLAEDSFNSGTGAAMFSGTGTIVDTTGAFQNTPADLTVDFSNAHLYTLTLQAVPEPTTMSLAAAGLLAFWTLRRRKE
jgi:PEP-CTERM motif